MTISSISSPEQFHNITNSGKNIVVGFRMKPCRICDTIWPEYQRLSNAIDDVEYYEVDINAQDAIADEVGVTAVPLFAVWRKGAMLTQYKGTEPSRLEYVIKVYAAALPSNEPIGATRITPIRSLTQFYNIVNSGKGIVVGFRTKQCRVCDNFWPTYERYSQKYSHIEFYEVEANEQNDIVEAAEAYAVPFFVGYKLTTKISAVDGADAEALKSLIENYI